MPWLSPSLSLRWGSYTKLDGDEQQKIVATSIAAKDAGIVTRRMAVEKIASVFDIENVDAVLEALKLEDAEKLKKAQDMMSAGVGPDGKPAPKPGEAPADSADKADEEDDQKDET